MLSYLRCALVPMLVVGLLFAAEWAAAASPEVKDGAGFFSADVVKKANEQIKEIKEHHQKDMMIETVTAAPKEAQELRGDARNKFFEEWAAKQAKAANVNDIYIVMTKQPSHL